MRLDRPLFYLFWQRLLSSGVRVSNGDDADYYFIPIKFRMGATDNRLAVEAVDYIRKHWPWWDRFGGGSRHILIHTGDMGRVESEARVQSLLANATWLTHWGLTRKHEYAQWKESHRVGKDIVIPIFLQPGLVDGYGMRQTPLHPALQESSPERTQTFFFAGRVRVYTKHLAPSAPDPLAYSILLKTDMW